MSSFRNPMKMRKGIGVVVQIPTTTNYFPATLEGRDIKVVLRDPARREVEVENINIDQNLISFTFSAMVQKYIGRYSLSVYENMGCMNQNIVDKEYFIELVESTELADECCCDKLTLPCANFKTRELDIVVGIPAIVVGGSDEDQQRMITIVKDYNSSPGTKVYYTTDGSDPREGGGVLYNRPFVVAKNCTVKAAAVNGGVWSAGVAIADIVVTDVEMWYGSSAGIPTTIGGNKKVLTNGATVQIVTESADRMKCHWVAVKVGVQANVSSWKDVDNDSIKDLVQQTTVDGCTVWYYLSSGFISNVSNVVMSVG